MQHPQVACFGCGKRISGAQILYRSLRNKHVSADDAFNELGIDRYCCRIQVANPPIQPFQPTEIPPGSKIQRRTHIDGIVHVVELGSTSFIKRQEIDIISDTEPISKSPDVLVTEIKDRPMLVD